MLEIFGEAIYFVMPQTYSITSMISFKVPNKISPIWLKCFNSSLQYCFLVCFWGLTEKRYLHLVSRQKNYDGIRQMTPTYCWHRNQLNDM